MTERDRLALTRSASALAIGPSSVAWEGDALAFDIDEIATPLPYRLRGKVRVHPSAMFDRSFDLDRDGRHTWRPAAPCARVEVALQAPALSWSGNGYFDINAGSEPLETGFKSWDWSYARLKNSAVITYDVVHRVSNSQSLALHCDATGKISEFAYESTQTRRRTAWALTRNLRSDRGHPANVRKTIENGPFYARSILSARVLGEPVAAMHESLSLTRFRQPWVQALLPYRMPRRITAREG